VKRYELHAQLKQPVVPIHAFACLEPRNARAVAGRAVAGHMTCREHARDQSDVTVAT
jgi:hypothetical protein